MNCKHEGYTITKVTITVAITLRNILKSPMAAGATGVRVVFFGSHKQPSYVVETCNIPSKDQLKDGEILVKILLATICSIDIENIDGKREVRTPR